MPSAVTTLKKVQVGQEAAWGTAAVATAKLMGVTDATMTIVDTVYQSPEQSRLYPSDMVAETLQTFEGSIEMDLSYDDFLYPLDNFYDQISASGTTAPYTWTYASPTGTAAAPNFYTLEFGAPAAEYEVNGVLFTTMTITGEAGGDGIWRGTFDWIGEDASATTMTVLADRNVEMIRMADTVLYIDTWAGTMGSSTATATLISFELSLENGRHLKPFAGSIRAEDWGYDKYTGQLTTVLEYNATAKAIVDALIAPALIQRQIQIVGTSGADSATIQFCGTLIDGAELFSDRDGNITVELVWEGTYNDTFAGWCTFILINSIAALT